MRTNSGINQSDHVDRARRVGEFVQREVTDLIRHEFNDPRFNLVTVTDVRVTRDLRNATVYVSRADFISELTSKALSGDGRDDAASKVNGATRRRSNGTKKKADDSDARNKNQQPDYVVALNRASARIRHLLAQRMTTKSTPRLQFEFDEVLEQGHRISSILESTAADGDAGEGSDTVDRTTGSST